MQFLDGLINISKRGDYANVAKFVKKDSSEPLKDVISLNN